ncbi:thiamine pyrophosphate-binding protein [Clostridium aestuarii]|uniref:Thiamine pyrophosphate-binding protein n=1 Tax=Clostridium aestuarii TaxID=338193 RepID=A0ABT4CUU0_9CLOT|nr:thiamine pyrophosphate-binding protein [Clostridium aestuarii]MCY6482748.1 thiamine pyrophosphate-binding protein [Clostridium aestuarii]
MKVSDYLIKYLEILGVNYIFGYTGGAVTHLIDSINKNSSVKFIQCYHEQAAAFSATAYAKYSRNLGVAIATSGPGATNLITGIADAYFDSSPTLFITGQVNTYNFKYEANVRQKGFQETDIVSLVKPITKYSILIDDVNSVEKELKKAICIALSGRKGPVLIDIPMDIQRQEIKICEKSFINDINSMKYEISDRAIANIYNMIVNSKFPVILSGGGSSLSNAKKNLIKLSEKLGIPVLVSLMGKDSFPHDHRNFAGYIGAYGNRYGNIVLSKSDFLLVVGSRLDSRQIGNNIEPFLSKKIAWVDIDNSEIEGSRIHPSEKIIADANDFLEKMLCYCSQRNKTYKNKDKFLKGIEILKNLFSPLSELDRDIKNKWHYEVMKIISDNLNENDTICVDVGQNQMMAAQVIDIKENQRFINGGGMAAMGYALPAGIAISIATGNRCVVIVGDGGLQMNIQELNMVSFYNLPIIIIVFNNKSLGMIKQFQELYFNKNFAATDEKNGYKSCCFSKIAEAYGIDSVVINKESDLESRFNEIFGNSKLPILVEIEIDYQTFVYPKLEFDKPIDKISPYITKKENEIINNIFDF